MLNRSAWLNGQMMRNWAPYASGDRTGSNRFESGCCKETTRASADRISRDVVVGLERNETPGNSNADGFTAATCLGLGSGESLHEERISLAASYLLLVAADLGRLGAAMFSSSWLASNCLGRYAREPPGRQWQLQFSAPGDFVYQIKYRSILDCPGDGTKVA